MRENRPYGSEGGGIEINRSSLPLSNARSRPRAEDGAPTKVPAFRARRITP